MVEVLITNVKSETLSNEILNLLKLKHPLLKINFDLEDFNKPYPCGHSVLRIEGDFIDTNLITKFLQGIGVECDLLEERACV